MTDKVVPAFPDLSLLADIFKKYPSVQAVYLFGSAADGFMHAESDLDLALTGDSDLRAQKLDILADLAREGFCNVDLAILDTPDIVLRFEAVRRNRLVFKTEDFDAGAFYSLTVREYFDFLPYLKVQREAYNRRILHDGQGRSYS
jgi:predicted nucleotidyltransferase